MKTTPTATKPAPGLALRWFQVWRARWRHKLRNTPIALPIIAALAGVVAGLIVAILHEATQFLHEIIFGLPEHADLSSGEPIAMWRLLCLPAFIGLLAGVVMVGMHRRWPEDTADPIEANALFGGKMSMPASVRLVIATLISNAAGAAVGMEAAYSQIGAAICSATGQRLRLRRGDLRVITAAGAGAAIAAAFNAPFTGVFYAFELVLGSYTIATLAPVGLAVVTATLIRRQLLGDQEMFAIEHLSKNIQLWYVLPFIAIGLASGLLGIVVMRLVTLIEWVIRRVGVPAWGRPAAGGLVLGGLALLAVQALGAGHGALRSSLLMGWSIDTLALILLIKIVASATSLGAGFRGGLFSTSLLMGALLGALLGRLVSFVQPLTIDELQLFSLVGMGATGAAIIGAPLTMTLLAIETTGDFPASFGVLMGVVLASLLVRRTFGYSFATWRFHLRGVAIRSAHDVGWLGELTVGRIMRRDARTVPHTTPLATLREILPLGSVAQAFVVDEEGRYLGSVDVAAAHDRELDEAVGLIVAAEMTHGKDWVLTKSDSIRTALARFDLAEANSLAVVESVTDRRLAGVLTEAYALRRYAEEMERRRSDELGERSLYGGAEG